MKTVASLLVVMTFALLPGLGGVRVFGQEPSLAEVARKEAQRRRAQPPATRVYTNKDVRKAALAPVVVPKPDDAGEKAAPTRDAAVAEAAKDETDASDESSDAPVKDEAYWRRRMAEARDRLSRSRLFAEALQSRINALTTDFVNRDDPYQRETIARQRQEAMVELDRVTREIEAQTIAIAEIEEEARREGVPPGWLR